jgi:hypothetical protein
MLISLLAVIVSAVVEHFRLEIWNQGYEIIYSSSEIASSLTFFIGSCRNSINQIISNTNYNASAMSILYQIPQYCLIGTAEVFAGVAG